jgi:hypothetical protein
VRVVAVLGCLLALGAVAVLAFGRTSVRTPTFTRTPPAATDSRTAEFAYRIGLRRPRFRCSLDGGRWTRCRSRYRATGLAAGRHRFCVVVRGRSRVACYTWQVGAGEPRSFRMTATAIRPLLPGGDPVPVDIAFANPQTVPITVEDVAVTVAGAEPIGCASAIRVVGALAARPVIPAGSTRSLAELGVPQGAWPQLAMADGGNQDACQGAAIALALTGSARG